MGFKVQTSRNWLRSNASLLLAPVVQGSAACPHRLVLCFKEGNRAKIAGIPQLQFISLAHVFQARHDMSDVICHVENIFCVNKYVALVTFAGRSILNVSRGGQRQNKLYFPL